MKDGLYVTDSVYVVKLVKIEHGLIYVLCPGVGFEPKWGWHPVWYELDTSKLIPFDPIPVHRKT